MVKNSQVRVSVVFLLLLLSSMCLVVWTQQPPTSDLKPQDNSLKSSNGDENYSLTVADSEYTPGLDLLAKAKPTPRPTSTPTPTPTPTPKPSPTATPTPTPSPTPKPTATPTPHPTPTITPTPKPTTTPTPTPKPTASPTPSPIPTTTPTPTPIPTPEPTATSTPTPQPTTTPTSTPNPTQNQPLPPIPTATPTQNPTKTPTPTPNPTPAATIPATTDNGTIIDLGIDGNITSQQISNLSITANQSETSTAIDFTITGPSGTSGLGIFTVPKSIVPYGTDPTIYIDNEPAENSGFTEDQENYYVWFTTEFSTHEMTIKFALPTTQQILSFPPALALLIVVPQIILIYTVIAIKRLRKKPTET